MSYTAAYDARSISGLGDAELVCPAGTARSCPFVPAGQQMDWSACSCYPCIKGSTWKTAQLACNAGEAAQCAVADTRPCPAPSPCPSGTTPVGGKLPRQSKTGAWGTAQWTDCAPLVSSASVAQAARSVGAHWGLCLGLTLAAVIVYKVATG